MSDVETNTVTKTCTVCGDEKSIADFYRAKTCRDGHRTECKKCFLLNIDRKHRAAMYEENKEHKKAMSKHYYEANKEHRSAIVKVWINANKERCSANQKAWREANQDNVSTYSRNRRARLRDATGTHTADDIQNILLLQRKKCAVCSTSIIKGYHVDHIVALVNGGSNDKHNLQLLCQHCNCTKSSKDPIDFMNQNGRLL